MIKHSGLLVIKRPVKVLVVSSFNWTEIGSDPAYVAILKDELPKISEGKARVITLAWSEVRGWPGFLAPLVLFFKAVNRSRYCDVIYALDNDRVGLAAGFAALFLKKPLLLKISKIESKTSVVEKAARIIVPSQQLKKIVLDWGINEEKVFVLPEMLPEIKDVPDKTILRKKMKVQGEIVVSVGRLERPKGFLAVIEAMAEVVVRHPDAKLLIVGEGPERQILEDKIKELKLEESVMLTGQIEKKLLHTYLRLADVFVLNSPFEGFSRTILEALYLGVPVVTTPGAGGEIVENGKEGLLVPHNDSKKIAQAVGKILSDQSLAVLLSEQAHKTAKRHCDENIIKKFIEIILSVRRG